MSKKSHHGPGEREGERVSKFQPPGEPPLIVRTARGPRFAKGHKLHGGRKFDPLTGKWSPNKVTAETKKLMFELVKYGLKTAKADYRKARRESSVKALGALISAAEYILPKLARHEEVGPGGGPVVVELVSLSGPAPSPPKQNDTVEPPPGGDEE